MKRCINNCYNGSGNAVHGALDHMEAFVKVVSEA